MATVLNDTFLWGIDSVSVNSTLIGTGSNNFSFPLNPSDYDGEEIFQYGGRAGFVLVASGDVEETVIDFRPEEGFYSFYAFVVSGTGISLGGIYVDGDLSMANINKAVWDRCVQQYGSNALTNFQKFNTIYIDGFSVSGNLYALHRGTGEAIWYSKKMGDNIYGSGTLSVEVVFDVAQTYNSGILRKATVNIIGKRAEITINKNTKTLNSAYTGARFLVIHDFTSLYHYIENFSSAGWSNYNDKDLFGVNSLMGFLNRMTMLKMSEYSPSSSSFAINTYSVTFNRDHDEYNTETVPYKIIPLCCNSRNDCSNYNMWTYSHKDTDSVSDMVNQMIGLSSALLKDNEGGIDSNLSIDEQNSTLTFTKSHIYDTTTANTQTINVFLYDEDEYYCNLGKNYKAKKGYNMPFAPTPLLDINLNYSLRIYFGKYIEEIQGKMGFNFRLNNSFEQNDFNKIYYTPYGTTRLQLISSGYSDKSLGGAFVGRFFTNESMQKEMFTIQTDDGVVIDGIPYAILNSKYFLTGTMVFLPSDKDNLTFNLFVGARKFSKSLIDRITHTITNVDINSFGNAKHSSMIIDSSAPSGSVARTLQQSDITNYGTRLAYGVPLKNYLGYELEPYANKMATIEDVINKLCAYNKPQLQLKASNESPSASCGLYYSYGKEDISNEVRAALFDLDSEIYDKCSVVRSVKVGSYLLHEYNHNIRFMKYPTYNSATTTIITYISGIVISNFYYNDDTSVYIANLGSSYNTLKNWWERESLESEIQALTAITVREYYCDGVIASVKELPVSILQRVKSTNTYKYSHPEVIDGNDILLYYTPVLTSCLTTSLGNITQDENFGLSDLKYTMEILDTSGKMVPTVDTVCKNSNDCFFDCGGFMRFDINNGLFYLDLSFKISIPPSLYNIKYKYEDSSSFNDFKEYFSINIRYYDTSDDLTVYPFVDEEWSKVNNYYIKNDVLYGKCRIYEKYYYAPFNASGTRLKISINYPLYDVSTKDVIVRTVLKDVTDILYLTNDPGNTDPVFRNAGSVFNIFARDRIDTGSGSNILTNSSYGRYTSGSLNSSYTSKYGWYGNATGTTTTVSYCAYVNMSSLTNLRRLSGTTIAYGSNIISTAVVGVTQRSTLMSYIIASYSTTIIGMFPPISRNEIGNLMIRSFGDEFNGFVTYVYDSNLNIIREVTTNTNCNVLNMIQTYGNSTGQLRILNKPTTSSTYQYNQVILKYLDCSFYKMGTSM
jgi:hypothetical protein